MHDAAGLGDARLAQDGERVIMGLAQVQTHGKPVLLCHLQLLGKDLALHVARTEVVMIIEPHLAQAARLGAGEQLFQLLACFLEVLGVVRMHAAGKAYARHDGLGHPPLLEQCRSIIEPRIEAVVGITRRPSRHVSVVAVKLGSCRIGHAADEVDAMGRRLRKREPRFGKHAQMTMRVGDKRTVRQFGSRLDLAL